MNTVINEKPTLREMKMSKQVAEGVAELERELAEALAFRFTEDVPMDMPPPDSATMSDNIVFGWSLFGAGMDLRVEKTWSASYSHGHGWPDAERRRRNGGSQKAIWQYSTELTALRAMRRRMEVVAKGALARVDMRIRSNVENGES